MSYARRLFYCAHVALATTLLCSSTAFAGSHLWRFSEIFSNADGTIQYIEFHESGGSDNEFHMTGKSVDSNANSYVFPTDLPGPTANLYFLVGTQAYADLPGVPAPDYVIPTNFFDPSGDTLSIEWYDTVTFSDGDLPTDGVHSMNPDLTSGVSSPTNFAGETGTVDLTSGIPVVPWWALALLAAVLVGSVGLVLRQRQQPSRA
jgi:hypothetical protein